jgi:GNAT superfamily N-acetyltransferase
VTTLSLLDRLSKSGHARFMFRTQESEARPARRAGAVLPVQGPDRPFQVAVAGPADSGLISDFIGGLSVRTQFLRFFASVARPSSSLLRALSGGDGRSDVLIATDQAGAVVGHGMAVDQATAGGSRVADLGLVVADRWQGRGVGSALLGLLAQRAAGRGASELVMDVLPGNDRMLAMIGRRWPEASHELGRDSVMIRVRLRAAAPARPGRAA